VLLSRVISCPRLARRGVAAALFFPLVLLAGLAVGCTDADPPKVPSPSANATLSLELITTIGCSECDGAEQITPTVIALLHGGRLAVLDRYEPFVRIFGSDGEPETSFGSPGQGPGELGNNLGGMYLPGVYLLPWPGGELSVVELMPAVVETFAPDGTFLNEVSIDALTLPDGYQVTPFVVTGDRLAAISNQPDGSARINVYRVVES